MDKRQPVRGQDAKWCVCGAWFASEREEKEHVCPGPRELMGRMVRGARLLLQDAVRPRDDTERAIVNALGDCSWDECVDAIDRHRTRTLNEAAPSAPIAASSDKARSTEESEAK